MSGTLRWVAAITVAAVVVATSGLASAQAPPQQQQAAPPPAPYAPPPGYGQPAPPAQNGYVPPPQSAYVPPPQGPSQQQMFMYEENSKSQGLALALEFLFPGVGSIYAGHPIGAAVTWGLQIGGVALAIAGVGQLRETEPGIMPNNDMAIGMIVGGVALAIGGRIYGLVDSWSSAGDYNTELAGRLGLADVSLIVAPVRAGNALAWGPALSLRF